MEVNKVDDMEVDMEVDIVVPCACFTSSVLALARSQRAFSRWAPRFDATGASSSTSSPLVCLMCAALSWVRISSMASLPASRCADGGSDSKYGQGWEAKVHPLRVQVIPTNSFAIWKKKSCRGLSNMPPGALGKEKKTNCCLIKNDREPNFDQILA